MISEEELTDTATGAATAAATGTPSTDWKAEAIKAAVNSQNPEISLETIERIAQGEREQKSYSILVQAHKEKFLQSAIVIKNSQKSIGENQEESNKWLALMSPSRARASAFARHPNPTEIF